MALRGFKKPKLPDEFFLGVDGVDIGRFKATDFVPYEPERGAVMAQYPGERPVILRVLRQDGDTLTTKAGDGTTQTVTIRAV